MHKLIYKRRLAIFCSDIVMVTLSWVLAYSLYFNFNAPVEFLNECIPYLLTTQSMIFYLCGLYRGLWRFASIPDLVRILKAVGCGVLCLLALFYYKNLLHVLFSLAIIYGSLLMLCLSGPRIFYRYIKDNKRMEKPSQRVLIVGAGNAGERVARELKRLRTQGYSPIAFVDDDIHRIGEDIQGIRVVASCQDIPHVVQKLKIDLNLIAIPSANPTQMERLINLCEKSRVSYRTLPSLQEIAEGRINIRVLPDVSLEKILGRTEVNLHASEMNNFVANKVIAISGGGGSIGSELCLQIAALNPAKLIIIDNSEFNLYSIDLKLRQLFPHVTIHPYLMSVTDHIGIESLFIQYKPNYVFHAAAYKHVPLLESQLRIAVHNNIIGTRTLAETAVNAGCEWFVLISSDKAVNPTNIMGATKRAAESLCSALNEVTNTRFVTVRFGNVLNSAGSVVPLFRKQLTEGGPLTVTHPEITRFFMTISEASQLIIQAATLGNGGEIFVLDMGEPIKIRYLAEKMIQLSGKVVDKDVHIHYTGLRPGEKLHEELFYGEEELTHTPHHKIKKAHAQKRQWQWILKTLDELEQAYVRYDDHTLFALLQKLVPEYQRQQHKQHVA